MHKDFPMLEMNLNMPPIGEELSVNFTRDLNGLMHMLKSTSLLFKSNFIGFLIYCRIYKKFMKNFFCVKDNILDKKMT